MNQRNIQGRQWNTTGRANPHALVVISETVSVVISQKNKDAALSTLVNAQKKIQLCAIHGGVNIIRSGLESLEPPLKGSDFLGLQLSLELTCLVNSSLTLLLEMEDFDLGHVHAPDHLLHFSVGVH